MHWNLHAAYANSKEYKKDCSVLSKYVNPFSPNADYKEIYQLAMSAASVGKTHEAITFLKIAKLKVPPMDTEHVEKIDNTKLLSKKYEFLKAYLVLCPVNQPFNI